jgi:hypothetical protein
MKLGEKVDDGVTEHLSQASGGVWSCPRGRDG